jgi:hypothetical protein
MRYYVDDITNAKLSFESAEAQARRNSDDIV